MRSPRHGTGVRWGFQPPRPIDTIRSFANAFASLGELTKDLKGPLAIDQLPDQEKTPPRSALRWDWEVCVALFTSVLERETDASQQKPPEGDDKSEPVYQKRGRTNRGNYKHFYSIGIATRR